MNKEIKDKWVTALRSGKYKQTTGALRRVTADGESGFCCLGVLCDVVDPDGWDMKIADCEGVPFRPGHLGELPVFIRDELCLSAAARFSIESLPSGLKAKVRKVIGVDDGFTSLSMLNDQGGSFRLIAAVIAAEPEWLPIVSGEAYAE